MPFKYCVVSQSVNIFPSSSHCYSVGFLTLLILTEMSFLKYCWFLCVVFVKFRCIVFLAPCRYFCRFHHSLCRFQLPSFSLHGFIRFSLAFTFSLWVSEQTKTLANPLFNSCERERRHGTRRHQEEEEAQHSGHRNAGNRQDNDLLCPVGEHSAPPHLRRRLGQGEEPPRRLGRGPRLLCHQRRPRTLSKP